jgi:hypothetical protein
VGRGAPFTGKLLVCRWRYSIADIALYAYTHSADEVGFDLSGYESIPGWLIACACNRTSSCTCERIAR